MAVAAQYTEFLAASELRRATLRSTPLRVAGSAGIRRDGHPIMHEGRRAGWIAGVLQRACWGITVFVVFAACRSKNAPPVVDVGPPSVENGRRLFASSDLDAVAHGFESLDSGKRGQWATFLDQQAPQLRTRDQCCSPGSTESFCAVVAKIGPVTSTAESTRWNQLTVACSSLEAVPAVQRWVEADGIVTADAAEVKKITDEIQALKKKGSSAVLFNGFITHRFDAHTYEVAEAQTVDAPRRRCYGEADCNAAEFSRMANPPVRLRQDHAILKTHKAVFDSIGQFSLGVEVRGSEKHTNSDGFERDFVVLEEADQDNHRLEEEVASRQKRAEALIAEEKKEIEILRAPDDDQTYARIAQARARVEAVLEPARVLGVLGPGLVIGGARDRRGV
jgi:hypothetical protein